MDIQVVSILYNFLKLFIVNIFMKFTKEIKKPIINFYCYRFV